MSNSMNKVYNDESTPDFSVSMLKETISLLRDYIHETRKEKTKLAKIIYEIEIPNLSPMKH